MSQPLAHLTLPMDRAEGQATALLIAAEFALQNNNVAQATRDYAAAAKLSRDPRVAKRAVQLAVVTHDAGSAQALIARWQALGADPRDLAGARAQLAMLDGDRALAEQQFRVLLAGGGAEAWKTFTADLLMARDRALAGVLLESLATPAALPPDESVWIALSQLGEQLGRHTFARTLADAAVNRFGGVDSIRWAASLRIAIGDRAGAEALYAKGVARHPHSVPLRLGYAALLAGQDRYAVALKVLAAGPQTQATWEARVAYAARGQDKAAIADLYAKLQHAPASERTDNAFLLGQLAELLGHDRDALRWYGEVDPDGDHGFDAQVRSAVLLDKAGQHAEAATLVHQLEQDYSDDPDNLRTAYELEAQLHARVGDHAAAISAYDRGLVALPGDPVLLYDRGIEEANAGNIDAAVADFRKVLAKHPDNVDAMNALGFTLADADRDLPEATRLLGKAIAAKPDVPAIMDSWGWLQFRLGHLDTARSYLERAWARAQDPDIGVHLGQVLWKLGQQSAARAVFAKVRALDPGNAALKQAERTLQP
ncbi:MAG TPA: tetratricopeptide repeat protein [Rhodanobacteraceae bacterium]|nr:tetratricopeptide repeat protein [Rhodanobacteraceae bacterium]